MQHLTRAGIFWMLQLLPLFSYGQTTDSLPVNNYSDPQEYELGGVEVTGNEFSDPGAVIGMSGLKVGEPLRIPGPKISGAVKNLMDLRLFTDVQIVLARTAGEVAFLEIRVQERPRLAGYTLQGVKKSWEDDLRSIIDQQLYKGAIVTENQRSEAARAVRQFFIEKGYADAGVRITQTIPPQPANSVLLHFGIDPGRRVKVADIRFTGNEQVSDKKLKKVLGIHTKGRLFAASKLIPAELEAGKAQLLTCYNTLGYRDARITGDRCRRNGDGEWVIELAIEEGRPYYFGTISWKGNALYSAEDLDRLLGIEPGTLFNPSLLENRLRYSPDGSDLSAVYMDDGYLFFKVEPVERAIHGDTIDLEIHLFEGPQATVDRVAVEGNSRTHDHVILRELRTKPGQKFSRSDIIRSQRELINLGYFNPETLDLRTPVNPERGTVDIEYAVEEKSNDQFELAAGWGGSSIGVTGTAGIALNNFSLRNLFNPEAWTPYPSGDGQRLSMRVQSNGRPYQSYNLSFTEPWLGGRRPNSLTLAGFSNRYTNGLDPEIDGFGRFAVLGLTASLGTRLHLPDDNFVATYALNFQRYHLQDWTSGLFRTDAGQVVSNGHFYNVSFSGALTRSTIRNPVFPTEGSRFSLSVQLTPPYSLFAPRDYSEQSPEEKFRWLEYHKWRFDADWYAPLGGKLVLRAAARFGFLGSYNRALGTAPFERFQLGGDGLNNIRGGFTGTDIFALRGYEIEDLENNLLDGKVVATPLFNKYTLELRYPISLNPGATLYALGFLEGGNAFRSFSDYNPFDLKRSAGVGLRVFLPIFGTLGFDYGIGFDKAGEQSLGNMGKFSIILGFEPQ